MRCPIPMLSGLLCCVTLCSSLLAQSNEKQSNENTYQLQVVTDRENALYMPGETAQFEITLTRGGQPITDATVTYVVDDFITDATGDRTYPRGELQLGQSASVAAQLSHPGFLRCEVTYRSPDNQTVKATAGAGFSPEQIPPSLPVPEDFDAFWQAQKAQLAELPLDPQLTPVTAPNDTVECFDVQVACTGGAPVSGYLARPKQAVPGSLPAILWVHGAGVRSASLASAVKGAGAGMLSLDINAHGIPNGKSANYYQELSAGRLRDYRVAGRENRETCYFRGMFLRLVRAIDFLTSQPEWDGRTVIVIGHSQGGGQALAAGGLDSRVTFIAAGVPAICDHTGRAAGRINGWPKLVPQGADGKPDPVSLEVSRYFDGVNFASRCRAGAIMSVGFIDVTCPPSSCYAAYNQLQGTKHMINEPRMGHAAPGHIHDAFFAKVLEHVREQSQ